MPGSSSQCPRRLAFTLSPLAGILLGLASACAHPTTTRQVEPAAAPPTDTTTASDLTSGTIQKRSYEEIASLLQSRTPGVDVRVAPDGSLSIRIHGPASFYGGGEPLYVIDGTPVEAGPGGALRGLNPYEIESIKVLKYAPETAIYGVRGANGVIVITTKRPKH
jgi:TonB-dependent SusC/RagA subfamily outer membrane receptor